MSLFISTMAMAAPVLNENAAINSFVTIYKDHADANLYYIAPQFMGVCLDAAGKPIFSFNEYNRNPFGSKRAVVMMTLCLRQHQSEMKAALEKVKQDNPNAKFAGVAFTSSELVLTDDVVKEFVEQNSCNHQAGVIGQEQACSFILNNKGTNVFIRKMQKGLTLVLQFTYKIEGVVKTPTGLEKAERSFSVAARVMKEDFNGKKQDISDGSIFP
jgi:hypothetical protein